MRLLKRIRKTKKTKRPVIERVNRANVVDQQPYLKCVKNHCDPKKTKKLRACSKDIVCESELTKCIDGKRERKSMNTGRSKSIVPNHKGIRGIYVPFPNKKKQSNIGIYHERKNPTYASIKQATPNYVNIGRVEPVRVQSSPKYERMVRPRAQTPKKSSKKSSPHIYSVARSPISRAQKKSAKGVQTPKDNQPQNFYVPGLQDRKTRNPSVKRTSTVPKKPSKLRKSASPRKGVKGVVELRKIFEQK